MSDAQEDPAEAAVCAWCSRASQLRCGRCKSVHYCSAECQRSHWKAGGHKAECAALMAAAMAPRTPAEVRPWGSLDPAVAKAVFRVLAREAENEELLERLQGGHYSSRRRAANKALAVAPAVCKRWGEAVTAVVTTVRHKWFPHQLPGAEMFATNRPRGSPPWHERFPSLTDLETHGLTDATVPLLLPPLLPGLRSLQVSELSCRDLTDEGVSALGGLTGLRGLCLPRRAAVPLLTRDHGSLTREDDDDHDNQCGIDGAPGALAKALSRLTGLQALRVEGGDEASMVDADLLDLSSLSQLTRLELIGMRSITPEGAASLLPSLPGLRALDLSASPCVSDASLAALATSLPLLEELRLDGDSSGGLMDAAPGALRPLSGTLRKLVWRTAAELQPADVRDIAALTNLTDLDLSFSMWESEEFVEALRPLSSMRRLMIEDCLDSEDIASAVLGGVALHFPALRHLDLSSCWGITKASVGCLSGLRDLRQLDMWMCKIDDGVLELLGGGGGGDEKASSESLDAFPALTQLNLCNAEGWSKEAMRSLKAKGRSGKKLKVMHARGFPLGWTFHQELLL